MQGKDFLQKQIKTWIQSTIMFLCCKLSGDFGELNSIAEWARKGTRIQKNTNISHLAFIFSTYVDFCLYRRETRIKHMRLCKVM